MSADVFLDRYRIVRPIALAQALDAVPRLPVVPVEPTQMLGTLGAGASVGPTIVLGQPRAKPRRRTVWLVVRASGRAGRHADGLGRQSACRSLEPLRDRGSAHDSVSQATQGEAGDLRVVSAWL